MNIQTTATFIGIACIATTAIAQDHPDHPDSVPATPLEKPKQVVQEEKLPPPTPLYIGDKAPDVTVDHWVKGDAWTEFEDGQVYVMEFWATWCGPCVSSMPHLSSLQDEYGDKIKIIGVSSEKDPEIVTSFLAKTNKRDNKVNNDRMRYTVAVDPDRSTSRVFMEASNQRGIPTSFIINGNGQVAWIGHPMSMDEPLKEVVAGTWDLAAAAEAFKLEAAQERAMSELSKVYRTAMETNDWNSWLTAIDEFTAEYGKSSTMDNAKFEALLNMKKDKKAAYAWANNMALGIWNDSQALNALAWGIVDETPEELQDLNFALKIATRASDLTEYKDPMILDTLARCYWEMGNTYKAIAWQEKAVSYLGDDPMNESITATLNEYKATLANVDE
ncbi:MAG: TlpA family protein disulfide reductase [Planctomycetes bacterium]|nr:TlpA family protein disulfide reductase [Planctomycetota bacterium]